MTQPNVNPQPTDGVQGGQSVAAEGDGTYTAPEGFQYEVYGFYDEVEDLDGSMVTIERAYEGGARRQATLGANERGNLVSSEGAAPAAE